MFVLGICPELGLLGESVSWTLLQAHSAEEGGPAEAAPASFSTFKSVHFFLKQSFEGDRLVEFEFGNLGMSLGGSKLKSQLPLGD